MEYLSKYYFMFKLSFGLELKIYESIAVLIFIEVSDRKIYLSSIDPVSLYNEVFNILSRLINYLSKFKSAHILSLQFFSKFHVY